MKKVILEVLQEREEESRLKGNYQFYRLYSVLGSIIFFIGLGLLILKGSGAHFSSHYMKNIFLSRLIQFGSIIFMLLGFLSVSMAIWIKPKRWKPKKTESE